MANKEKKLLCSFCGKHQDDVERMIIGPGVNICNECIELCCNLLESEGLLPQEKKAPTARSAKSAAPVTDINVMTPQ